MKPLLVLMFVSVSCAWAQDNAGLHARELFYTPVPQISQAQSAPAVPAPGIKSTPKRNPAPQPSVSQAGVSQTGGPANTGKAATPKDPAKDPARDPAPVITVSAAPANLGLRYSVLKRDPGGKFQEVDADTNFHSGDRIRVQVSANNSGYLYVVAQGSSGAWQLLFPSAEVEGGSNLIHGGEARVVPSGDNGQWVFNEQAGVEKLFVVLSRQPQSDLERLIYSIGGSPAAAGSARTLVARATVSDDVIERLRMQVSARDLVFEKVDGDAAGKTENAAYVVNPSAAPDARLVVDLSLKHK